MPVEHNEQSPRTQENRSTWSPVIVAMTYLLGSIILGPLVYLSAYLVFTPISRGDYCDRTAYGIGMGNAESELRDAEYRNVQIFTGLVSATLFGVGVAGLVWIWAWRRRLGWIKCLVGVAAVVPMMAVSVVLGFHAVWPNYPSC